MLPHLRGGGGRRVEVGSGLHPGLPRLTLQGCAKGPTPEHGSHLDLAMGQMPLKRNVAKFQSAMGHVPAVSLQETPFF